MKEIIPIKKLNAKIMAPSSKSFANRALIVASLADGKSVLENVTFSDDTLYMIKALQCFGIDIITEHDKVIVNGTGGKLKIPNEPIFVGNAGTTMRFITAFASLAGGKVVITGDERMQERPIKELLDPLNHIGIKAYSEKNNGCPPVIVEDGFLKGGDVNIHGNVSSQFVSAIMMISPLAKKEVTLNIVSELTSKPYVDITLDVMRAFGADVDNKSYRHLKISNNGYKPVNYFVEGDASSVSYFLAAAAITKGTVRVTGLNPNSVQGDIKFADILERMGCDVKKGDDFIEVKGSDLKGISVDMNSMPDTVQTLAVVALFADGKTEISNVANLRLKETDRLKALGNELRKLGADIEELDDGIVIIPRELNGGIIDTYNDHRMAMSFAVAGLVIPNVKVLHPECVSKSFPDFWEKFGELYG